MLRRSIFFSLGLGRPEGAYGVGHLARCRYALLYCIVGTYVLSKKFV